ncbi:MAG: CHAD domain-containing protein [Bacteroidota bacterium]|nr:CHAD domain-containing protein [Bacteroidota bacterium]
MLKRKIQEKHFLERAKSVDHCLRDFGKKPEQETLHRLRVEIKKIKAILLLQKGSFNDEKLPDEFSKVRKVFRKAGAIRAAALNIDMLKQHKIRSPEMKRIQSLTIKNESKRFRSQTDVYRKKISKSLRFFQRRIINIKDESILLLFRHELNQLSGFFRARLGTNQLHDCRKKLKNLLYVFDSLSPAIAKKIKLNKLYLKKLEEAIGQWHDVTDLIELMRKNGYTTARLPHELITERQRLRKNVHDLSTDFRENMLLGLKSDS